MLRVAFRRGRKPAWKPLLWNQRSSDSKPQLPPSDAWARVAWLKRCMGSGALMTQEQHFDSSDEVSAEALVLLLSCEGVKC